jgi:hypothetical protein
MRKALAQQNGSRSTYIGTFQRYGTKSGWKGRVERTVLLVDLLDAELRPVSDHLWLNLTKALEALDLQPGDTVQFDARVLPYLKGYQGRRDDVDCPVRWDYRLSRPTKVSRR